MYFLHTLPELIAYTTYLSFHKNYFRSCRKDNIIIAFHTWTIGSVKAVCVHATLHLELASATIANKWKSW